MTNSRYAQLNSNGSRSVVAINPPSPESRRHTSDLAIAWASNELTFIVNGSTLKASAWLRWPQIAKAFVFSLEKQSPVVGSITLSNKIAGLSSGFFKFLSEFDPEAKLLLSDIDRKVTSAFVVWLSRKSPEGKPVFAVSTRNQLAGAVKSVFDTLRSAPAWKDKLAVNYSMPVNPWPGANRRKTPLKVLDSESLRSLLFACTKEIQETMSQCNQAWSEMAAISDEDASSSEVPLSLAAWRRVYLRKYSKTLPHFVWLQKNDRQLFNTFYRLKTTAGQALMPIAPDGRRAAPFLILLSIFTAFNPDVLRNLSLDDFEYFDGLAGERIRFRPYKARSRREQIRSFATGNPLGPDVLIRFMLNWTQWIRPLSPADISSKVFLFMSNERNTDGSIVCADYNVPGQRKAGTRWNQSLKSFLEEHNLPNVSLAQLRKISLDLINEMTSGDLKAVQLAGGQRNSQVILDHYQSDAARQKNDEALALIMATRERWMTTQGKSADPRLEPHKSDKGCATPGWRCHDPYSSPIQGEIPGRLCQAVGMCPACPLSILNVQDPYSLARALQLKNHISLSQLTIAPERWLAFFAPVVNRLDSYWLPLVNDSTLLEEAGRLTLPPLPPLE